MFTQLTSFHIQIDSFICLVFPYIGETGRNYGGRLVCRKEVESSFPAGERHRLGL